MIRFLSRFTRFILTPLLCGLIWYGLQRVSFAANLTASDPTSPTRHLRAFRTALRI